MSFVFSIEGDWIGDGCYRYIPKCVGCGKRSADFRDTRLCEICTFHTPEYYEALYRPKASKCKTCLSEFESRNSLFRHLRDKGHEQ
nr:hypothetical protein MarFTME_115 [Marseillevirus futianmevirus]